MYSSSICLIRLLSNKYCQTHNSSTIRLHLNYFLNNDPNCNINDFFNIFMFRLKGVISVTNKEEDSLQWSREFNIWFYLKHNLYFTYHPLLCTILKILVGYFKAGKTTKITTYWNEFHVTHISITLKKYE